MIYTQNYFRWLSIIATVAVIAFSSVLSTMSLIAGVLAFSLNEISTGLIISAIGLFLGFMLSVAIDTLKYLLSKKVIY